MSGLSWSPPWGWALLRMMPSVNIMTARSLAGSPAGQWAESQRRQAEGLPLSILGLSASSRVFWMKALSTRSRSVVKGWTIFTWLCSNQPRRSRRWGACRRHELPDGVELAVAADHLHGVEQDHELKHVRSFEQRDRRR